MTSFRFICVCVPEPVCQIASGNSSACRPAMISSAAAIITRAFSSGNTPSARFTAAAARLTSASARISSGDGFSVEILKFRSERCVCAPHRRAAGTAISPKVSCSRRVVFIIRAQYYPVLLLTFYSRFTLFLKTKEETSMRFFCCRFLSAASLFVMITAYASFPAYKALNSNTYFIRSGAAGSKCTLEEPCGSLNQKLVEQAGKNARFYLAGGHRYDLGGRLVLSQGQS